MNRKVNSLDMFQLRSQILIKKKNPSQLIWGCTSQACNSCICPSLRLKKELRVCNRDVCYIYLQGSSPQPFWHQGLVLEKTIFPRKWVGGQFQDDSDQIRSVAQSCPTLCDSMNRSTPGLPVHHQLLGFTQTHVHQVIDAIQPSYPLSSPSAPAPNPSQHQSLFQ